MQSLSTNPLLSDGGGGLILPNVPLTLPRWAGIRHLEPEPEFLTLREVAVGWPFPAFRSTFWSEPDDRIGEVFHHRGGIELRLFAGKVCVIIPYYPLWRGLILDVMGFAALLWIGRSFIESAIIAYRTWQGRCPHCGYCMALLDSSLCPECGEPPPPHRRIQLRLVRKQRK